MHATVPPTLRQSITINFPTYSLRTDTSPHTTAVCQHTAQQDTCQRLHQAGFIADFQTESNAFQRTCKHPNARTVRSDGTRRRITVGQCFLPFRRSAPTLAVLSVQNRNITTHRFCNRPVPCHLYPPEAP
jgi:hypothetical protein